MNLASGVIKDLTNGKELNFKPLSGIMIEILENDGLVKYIKKYKKLSLNRNGR